MKRTPTGYIYVVWVVRMCIITFVTANTSCKDTFFLSLSHSLASSSIYTKKDYA
jgi:hypothetical protein